MSDFLSGIVVGATWVECAWWWFSMEIRALAKGEGDE
jgi:hypothetical protein